MGFEVHFAESIDKLGDNLKEIKPHFMPVVPRLLEKVFDKIVAKGNELSGLKKESVLLGFRNWRKIQTL